MVSKWFGLFWFDGYEMIKHGKLGIKVTKDLLDWMFNIVLDVTKEKSGSIMFQ